MPSTHLSERTNLNGILPPFPQRRDFDWDWNKVNAAARAGQNPTLPCSNSFPESVRGFGLPGNKHGLRTPPKEMNGNPIIASNVERTQYKRVPVAASNPPSYQTSLATLDNPKQASSRQPFYNSYYSATRPQSPVPPKKDHAAQSEQTARRRASNDSNSIASHLQIPASINDSKGSLPEFAAQITCFFWFESYSTLRLVEDATHAPMPPGPLVSEAMPTTGFRKWVTTILSMTQVSQNVILLALMFIYRLKKFNPGVKGKVGSEFRLLTVALMLGNKFLDDNTYTNKTWAEVSGISVQEIHVMEVEFLSNMRYTLFASEEEWKAWHVKLGNFSDYYDRASRFRTETMPRTMTLPTPQFSGHPHLPSPPASQNTSPPFTTNPSPGHSALPHPLSVPPFLAPNISSPSLPLPEVDLKPWSRKRSLEDHSSEPPAKRMSSLNPSSASSTTLTPSTLKDTTPTVPRLPMPNLSISTGSQHGSSPAQLPMPSGRAMSTVFTGPHRWPQNGTLPSLQSSAYLGQPGSARSGGSPLAGQPNRQSPYGTGPSTPSPTSFHFPKNAQTPSGLSPSGFPAPRNSPYKPIRAVNTLLVPPPSESLQNQHQNISYDQMHYQPLARQDDEAASTSSVNAKQQPQGHLCVAGGDDTFVGFPEHLAALVSHGLPKIAVKAVTYPKFETRGDLKDCVGRFREWLQNKVIDLEVAASTPSPTVEPSVHTILIGHSMGGIVAAETLLAITSDSPIPSSNINSDPIDPLLSTKTTTNPAQTTTEGPEPQRASCSTTSQHDDSSFMFPYIQGILAFDTPYLGISPGVISNGAEQHYKNASTAYSAISEVAGVLGYGSPSNNKRPTKSPQQQQANQKMLTQGADAMSASMTNATGDAVAVPPWQKWGKYAMFAGAAGAVAAGGAAAYLKRDTITEGWSFIGSHLEFVGCLAKGEELRSRLERIVKLNKERGIGFADLITVLGKGTQQQNKSDSPRGGDFVEIGAVKGIAPNERTFCTIPKSEKNRRFFEKAKNDKASDEMQAHMNMFGARENSGYFALCERAKVLIVDWVGPEHSVWYKESTPLRETTDKASEDVGLEKASNREEDVGL